MAMRLTGLMSGMDTESMIEQLVEAKKTKVTTAKKAQMKISYKQDAWKSLNTKIQKLQTKYISNMRFSSAYSKKTTKVSNSSAVSVITGENAVNGVQDLQINQLAKTGYLTGGKVASTGSDSVTALTKLSDLKTAGEDSGFSGAGTINVKTGSTSVDINVTADTTISDVLTELKNAGLNASFDEKQQRLFISAKQSGEASDFTITGTDADGLKAISALGIAAKSDYEEYAQYYVDGDKSATLSNMAGLIQADVTSKTNAYLAKYKTLQESLTKAQEAADALRTEDETNNSTSYADMISDRESQIANLQAQLDAEDSPLTEEDKKAVSEKIKTLQEEVTTLNKVADVNSQIADVEKYINVTSSTDADTGEVTYTAEASDTLKDEVNEAYYAKAKSAYEISSDSSAAYATKIDGQDAEITLNGATFTNNTNVFEINGLTFTALNTTAAGENITVTTEQDTDGIYDMVKDFLKEYNSVINEIDKLYNAESASKYEPLTSDEKESMSDSEIEEWETKIKDSILRRDDSLNTVGSTLKLAMSGGVDIDGKTYHLFDFGIETLSYFTAAENEKNAYHIDGDPDDSNTSGNADKLKSMISNNPDTVISFFTKLSQNVYTEMSKISKSVEGYRSYGSFYDDKKMKSDYDDYTEKIEDLEEKLNDYEDKWYSKFSAMETAMAKMQSNASAVTSLLGG